MGASSPRPPPKPPQSPASSVPGDGPISGAGGHGRDGASAAVVSRLECYGLTTGREGALGGWTLQEPRNPDRSRHFLRCPPGGFFFFLASVTGELRVFCVAPRPPPPLRCVFYFIFLLHLLLPMFYRRVRGQCVCGGCDTRGEKCRDSSGCSCTAELRR